MQHFTPTYLAGETGKNVRGFVKEHNEEFWMIFKPLIPFIAVLYLLDAVISDLFLSESKYDFFLGSLLASYFSICLTISWHRAVIKGPGNYTPMNPFKPKRHELAFLGMGVLVSVVVFSFAAGLVALAALVNPGMAGVLAVFVFIVAIYVLYRVMFYFPAKAIDNSITFKESFTMTKGHIWRIFSGYYFATYRVVLIALCYTVLLGIFGYLYVSITGSLAGAATFGFIVKLPLILYFQPLLTVLGVSVLSNYYLYVLQNPRETKGIEQD